MFLNMMHDFLLFIRLEKKVLQEVYFHVSELLCVKASRRLLMPVNLHFCDNTIASLYLTSCSVGPLICICGFLSRQVLLHHK